MKDWFNSIDVEKISKDLYEKFKDKLRPIKVSKDTTKADIGHMCLLKKTKYSSPEDLMIKVLLVDKNREGEYCGFMVNNDVEIAGPYDVVIDRNKYDLNYTAVVQCWNYVVFQPDDIASCLEKLPDDVVDVCRKQHSNFFAGYEPENIFPEGIRKGNLHINEYQEIIKKEIQKSNQYFFLDLERNGILG